jgi:hypothetical protein
MRTFRLTLATLSLGLLAATSSLVAQAPAGSTGRCSDGTYTSAKTKSGACSRHGGVKEWFAAPTAVPTSPPPAPPKRAPAPVAVSGRPAGATGSCNDGSFTTAKTKSGACSRHGGVKEWFAGAPAPAPAPPPPPPPPPAAGAPSIRTAPIAGAPANATALCNDGTYSESQHRSGTCSKHKGVKQWLKELPPG